MLKAARVKKSLLIMVFCFGEFETKEVCSNSSQTKDQMLNLWFLGKDRLLGEVVNIGSDGEPGELGNSFGIFLVIILLFYYYFW